MVENSLHIIIPADVADKLRKLSNDTNISSSSIVIELLRVILDDKTIDLSQKSKINLIELMKLIIDNVVSIELKINIKQNITPILTKTNIKRKSW